MSSITGDWNGFQYGNVKWNTNRGTLFWLLSLQFTYIVQQTGIAQSYFKQIDTNTKNTVSQISSLRDQLGSAQKGVSLSGWVYTLVVDLQELKTNLGGLQNGVSVSGWLHTLVLNLQTLSNNIGGQQHGASLSGWVYTLVTEIQALRNQIGPLQKDTSLSGWVWTIAVKSSSVYDLLDNITKGPEGSRVSLYSIGSAIETIKNETRDLDNLLSDAVDILVSLDDRVAGMDSAFGVRLASIGLSIGDIGDLLESQKGVVEEIRLYTSRHVLDVPESYSSYTLWDLLYSLMSDSDNVVRLLVGLQQSVTAWADRWDSVGKDASWSDADKLSLFAKLDGISNRLSVMAAKDVLDALVGDLDFTRLAALSAEVEGAISSAFPFCIPAVLKQVLGLVAADPAPPCWEFDIAGEPLLCDFAPFQPVADVTGWVARICFLFALLVNTRRFVYMGGGAE